MSRIRVYADPLDSSKVLHLRTDNAVAVFSEIKKKHAQARIYLQPASQENDITPTNVVGLASLQILAKDKDFDIVCHAGEAATIIAIASLVLSVGLAVYTYMNMPDLNQGQMGSGNNELATRVNKERINGRVPDIFGKLKAYPDLITAPFEYYENNREIEECVMCLGRGYYQIHNVQESGNAIESIEGMSASIYDPNVSITSTPMYRAGELLSNTPIHAVKSKAINGQSLETPTKDVMAAAGDLGLFFTASGEIKKSNNALNFSDFFAADDQIAIVGADFLGSNQLLTGQAEFNNANQIIITREYDVTDFDEYEKIAVTGANLYKDIVTVDETTREEKTERAYFDLSGTYTILSVSKILSGLNYIYTISLSNPEYINPNWSIYVDAAYSTYSGLEFLEPVSGIDLGGYYTIESLTAETIKLVNPELITNDWLKISNLPSSNTASLIPENQIRIEIVDNKWVGWYDLELEGAQQCVFNIIMPQGISNVTNKGAFTHAFVNIEVQCEAFDSSRVKLGPTLSQVVFIEDATRDAIGRTLRINLPGGTQSIRFRSAKISAQTRNSPITETKLKSVYITKPLEKLVYDDFTIVRTRTPATKGALSLKERKLSVLTTRKVYTYASGVRSSLRIPTSNFADIVCALHTDNYIGRREIDSLDIANLYSTSNHIQAYFGTSKATEFNYTFDKSNLSYEESLGYIAPMVFCNPRHMSNQIYFQFERENPHSSILFNHANKKPSSETLTRKLVRNNEYDGVEAVWQDPNQDWSEVTIKLPNDLISNPKKVDLIGITNSAQAHFLAHRAWNKIRYQRKTVQFGAYGEADLVTLNDRIAVVSETISAISKLNDESKGYASGCVEEQINQVIRVSAPILLDPTKDHAIHLQLKTGAVEHMEITQGVDEFHLILERLPYTALVTDDDRIVKTTYSITSSDNPDVEAYLVSEKSPTSLYETQITAINYDARYYTNDKDIINNLI